MTATTQTIISLFQRGYNQTVEEAEAMECDAPREDDPLDALNGAKLT